MEPAALQPAFEQAVIDSKSLSERPDNETLLKIYGLYKQATEGDCHIDPPSNPFDFVHKAKYEAWQGLAGMSSNAAMQEYVEIIKKLKAQ
jgi:diazepam-binding inhibitor (GABA receptor modulating acyl-CoA-binding protein)